jgi:hypothetical protein
MTLDRKKQFKNKVNDAYNRLKEVEIPDPDNREQINRLIEQHLQRMQPTTLDDAEKLIWNLKMQWTTIILDLSNLTHLKKYLDDDYPGDDICDKSEPLQLMVETPYTDPKIGVPEGRWYMATYGKTPNYEQVIFDQLKKYDLVEEDSQISDYSFLFLGNHKT